MPIPGRVRTVISGTLPGGEVFGTGFDTLGEAGNQATLQAAADAVALYVQQAAGVPLISLLSPDCAITKVTAYSYAPGAIAAGLIAEKALNLVGQGPNRHPNQVALVFSTRTALPGRRFRGRMYWPATGCTLGVNGLLSSPTAAAVATAAAGLLKCQGADIQPIVVSRVAATATNIVQVKVDTRLDVQRGRAGKQQGTGAGTAAVA